MSVQQVIPGFSDGWRSLATPANCVELRWLQEQDGRRISASTRSVIEEQRWRRARYVFRIHQVFTLRDGLIVQYAFSGEREAMLSAAGVAAAEPGGSAGEGGTPDRRVR